jgi:ATP-binding cassette subfamily C protein
MLGQSNLRTIRRFVRALVSAAPRQAALTAVVMLCLSVVEGVSLVLLVPLLQLVGVDAGTPGSGRVGDAVAAAFRTVGLTPTLGRVLAVYVAIAVIQSLLQRWQTVLSASMRQQTEAVLRMRLYAAIGRAAWQFVARSRMSSFAQVLTSELDHVGTAAHDLVDLAVVSLIALVYITIALRVSPEITALVLVSGATVALVLRRRVSDAHKAGEEMSATRARLYAAVSDHLGSLKTAKSYGAVDRQHAAFERLTSAVRNVNLETIGGYARLRQETAVGSALALALTVYVARAVLAVPTAHLLMLLVLFARLMPRLTGLLERAQTFATMLPSFAAFDALEAQCVAAAERQAGRPQPIRFEHAVTFDRVTFSYDGKSEAALADVTFEIRAGATTAFVGPSGAGKSTIADLLLGLIEPTSGRILVDGQVLDASRLAAWREQIGYVHQDSFLFHDTIRANLLWARPAASSDELDTVLRLAAADGFVSSLPAGMDTVIGDRGVLLSGGERQRIALARALLRQPTLLVLDEATNALDAENERRIQEAIEGIRHQTTVVVITHRLSTVRTADAIHVLDRARLTESGSWTDLMAQSDGRFRQLCQIQTLNEQDEARPDWAVGVAAS